MTECRHLDVMPDPVTGDWTCVKCLEPFRQIPEVDDDLPRVSTLWQRIRWAFRPRKKVRAVPFVWTLRWAKARESKEFTWHQWEPHWGKSRDLKKFTRADARKIYTHSDSRSKITRIK